MTFDPALAAFGFVVGLLVGLTGMGGGVLMTPLLMLGLGMPATAAVATDLAYSLVTKLAGSWQHLRQGTVDMKLVRTLAIGSVPASALAVTIIGWLERERTAGLEQGLARAVGGALVVAAGLLAWRALSAAEPRPHEIEHRRAAIIAVGAVGGLLVGFTSVGSGSVIMGLLVFFVPLAPRTLVGSDVVHAAILVGVAAAGHALLGNVDVPLAAQLLVGSIPGVLIGSRLTLRAPRRILQAALAALLTLSGLRLLLLPDPDPSDQVRKPRVGAERIEKRRDLELQHPSFALGEALLEPEERPLRLAKAEVEHRHVVG
jgi:uncharacterized membrane protein YfcA